LYINSIIIEKNLVAIYTMSNILSEDEREVWEVRKNTFNISGDIQYTELIGYMNVQENDVRQSTPADPLFQWVSEIFSESFRERFGNTFNIRYDDKYSIKRIPYSTYKKNRMELERELDKFNL